MHLFASWVKSASEENFDVTFLQPPAVFLNKLTSRFSFSKWLSYIDIYILTTLMLAIRHYGHSCVITSDHGNSPTLQLVPKVKRISVVHDTIALRQASGDALGLKKTRMTGAILQKAIVGALKRCSFLFTNPSPVPEELSAMGVAPPKVILGCIFDPVRLKLSDETEIKDVVPFSRFKLNVGTDEPRKRVDHLLRMWKFHEQIDPDCWLVLVGRTSKKTKDYIEQLNLKRVAVLGRVSDAALAALYANCEALLIASSEEGFGIPILEAIAFGKRVITPADTPFFRTVFGLCVDPIMSFDAEGAQALTQPSSVGAEAYNSQRDRLLHQYGRSQFVNVISDALTHAYGHTSSARKPYAGPIL